MVAAVARGMPSSAVSWSGKSWALSSHCPDCAGPAAFRNDSDGLLVACPSGAVPL